MGLWESQRSAEHDWRDYEFWLAFVRYTYSDDRLSFEVYMARAKDFDEDDFVEFKKKDGVGRQIRRDAFMKKAELVFLSKAARTKLYTEYPMNRSE